jgi:hypothetical protein
VFVVDSSLSRLSLSCSTFEAGLSGHERDVNVAASDIQKMIRGFLSRVRAARAREEELVGGVFSSRVFSSRLVSSRLVSSPLSGAHHLPRLGVPQVFIGMHPGPDKASDALKDAYEVGTLHLYHRR